MKLGPDCRSSLYIRMRLLPLTIRGKYSKSSVKKMMLEFCAFLRAHAAGSHLAKALAYAN
jgi:hypothetical protein